MSNNLNLSQMTEGQASPEVTHNDGIGQLDAALTETFTADVTSGNVTLTSDQYRRCVRVLADNASVARDVTLPAVKRLVILEADAGNSADVTFKLGTTSIALAAGERIVAFSDGTTNGLFQVTSAAGGGSQPFDPQIWIRGKPDDGATVLRMNARRAFSIPTDMAGSAMDSVVSATADATFTFYKNGVSFGTAEFAAAANSATFTVTATDFDVDDIFEIEAPSPQDATLEGVSGNFAFTRT